MCNFSRILILSYIVLIYNCAGVSYTKLSQDNPEALIAMQDSLLLRQSKSSNLVNALVNAHVQTGIRATAEHNFNKASNHFHQALELNNKDTTAQYNLLLVEGHILLKKGNKNGLWDAIEKYARAGSLRQTQGEPHYWMAQAYLKLGDTDFDLILESYEKAINLSMGKDLLFQAKKDYNHTLDRKKQLDTFWK